MDDEREYLNAALRDYEEKQRALGTPPQPPRAPLVVEEYPQPDTVVTPEQENTPYPSPESTVREILAVPVDAAPDVSTPVPQQSPPAPPPPPSPKPPTEDELLSQYFRELTEGRQATREATLAANISRVGELLNQAFAGGPQKKPIDKAFDSLLSQAQAPQQAAEMDADRRLRTQLKQLRTMGASGADLDPASPSNRAYQASVRKLWADAGHDEAMLPLLNQKQINDALGQAAKSRGVSRADASLDLRREKFDLQKQDQDFDQAMKDKQFAFKHAKSTQDFMAAGAKTLRDYSKLVGKEFGALPGALEKLQESVEEVGGRPSDLERGLRGTFERLLARYGRGADGALNLTDPAARRLYSRIQMVANEILRSQSGLAVTENEAARLENALQMRQFDTLADTLNRIDDVRVSAAKRLRGYEDAFFKGIPQELLDASPNLITTKLPIFSDVFKDSARADMVPSAAKQSAPLPEPEDSSQPPEAKRRPPAPRVSSPRRALTPEEKEELEALRRELGE